MKGFSKVLVAFALVICGCGGPGSPSVGSSLTGAGESAGGMSQSSDMEPVPVEAACVCDFPSDCCDGCNAIEGPCDDGNICSIGDRCIDGMCLGTSQNTCDDNNVCTTDSCLNGYGCIHSNKPGPCSDNSVCTIGDTCVSGVCVPGSTILDCNDGNFCTDDVCDPVAGCQNKATTTYCEDNNPCTRDLCDPMTGCSYEFITAPCNDGDLCTGNDTCVGGVCVGGAGNDCDDGNPCTNDGCDLVTRQCVYTNNTLGCSDGNACTTGDLCAAGKCTSGAPTICDDGNHCTIDSCNVSTGCVFTPKVCNDMDPCTVDSCNLENGNCVFSRKTCDDMNLCTADSCEPVTGACLNMTISCDDGDVCTTDLCHGATGCYHEYNTAVCDDGNACTGSDACSAGSCVGGPSIDCSDGDRCTIDSCDPVSGCLHSVTTGACDDGDACTVDENCADGTCSGGVAVVCDDGNFCTADSCDSATGCVFVATTDSCDDGDACTVGDVCAGGLCAGVLPLDCDDGNVCTDDGCDPVSGCFHVNNTGVCEDGTLCTGPDTCAEGVCVSGPPVDCNDLNVCTNDSCSPTLGCVHVNTTGPCEDGNLCTTPDKCSKGSCTAGPAADCDDGNECTEDSCDPAVGCVNVPATGPCDDESICTTDDTCVDGVCTGRPALDCDDHDVCTTDRCDPSMGCMYEFNNAACEDGDMCTDGDACSMGACVSGATLVCDDDNVCTDDSCDSSTGCTFAFNSMECDDGDVCTLQDACLMGACTGVAFLDCDDENVCTDDACDPVAGCQYSNNTGDCQGGNLCADAKCIDGACYVTAKDCTDDDACTTDGCSLDVGCTHEIIAGCCHESRPCPADETCESGWCSPVGCRACETDGDCGLADARCVTVGQGTFCVTSCATDACDEGWTCQAVGEYPTMCWPDAGWCKCTEPESPSVCDGNTLIEYDSCGGIMNVETCANGCLEGEGCCPDGTVLEGAACVAVEVEPVPEMVEEGDEATVADDAGDAADVAIGDEGGEDAVVAPDSVADSVVDAVADAGRDLSQPDTAAGDAPDQIEGDTGNVEDTVTGGGKGGCSAGSSPLSMMPALLLLALAAFVLRLRRRA